MLWLRALPLVQSLAKPLHNLDVANPTIFAHHEIQDHRALQSSLLRLLGVLAGALATGKGILVTS